MVSESKETTEDKDSCCTKLCIKPKLWKMTKAKSTMNGRVAPSPRPNGNEVKVKEIKNKSV